MSSSCDDNYNHHDNHSDHHHHHNYYSLETTQDTEISDIKMSVIYKEKLVGLDLSYVTKCFSTFLN